MKLIFDWIIFMIAFYVRAHCLNKNTKENWKKNTHFKENF